RALGRHHRGTQDQRRQIRQAATAEAVRRRRPRRADVLNRRSVSVEQLVTEPDQLAVGRLGTGRRRRFALRTGGGGEGVRARMCPDHRCRDGQVELLLQAQPQVHRQQGVHTELGEVGGGRDTVGGYAKQRGDLLDDVRRVGDGYWAELLYDWTRGQD